MNWSKYDHYLFIATVALLIHW